MRPSLLTHAILTLTSCMCSPDLSPLHTGIVCALSVLFGLMPPLPSSSACVSRHTHQSFATRTWSAHTKPRKAGLLPAWLASDITPINHQPSGHDFSCCHPCLGGRASTCSTRLLVSYYGFDYKNIGKSHRGAITYWENIFLLPS